MLHLLNSFDDQQRERLMAGVSAALAAARNIHDYPGNPVLIEGTPGDFFIRLRGRLWHGRIGLTTFDQDLPHVLARFTHWLSEIDQSVSAEIGSKRMPPRFHGIDFGPKTKEETERGFIERMDVLMTQSIRDQMIGDKYRFPEPEFVTAEEISKAWGWDENRVRRMFGHYRIELWRMVWNCYKGGILKIPLTALARGRQMVKDETGETLPRVKPGPSIKAPPNKPGRPRKAPMQIKTSAKAGRPPRPHDEREYSLIADVLGKSQGNQVEAARILRIPYPQLRGWIARWEREKGIRMERARPGRPRSRPQHFRQATLP